MFHRSLCFTGVMGGRHLQALLHNLIGRVASEWLTNGVTIKVCRNKSGSLIFYLTIKILFWLHMICEDFLQICVIMHKRCCNINDDDVAI